ncbi:hypothetical protein V8B55DRAFT_1370951 [Mucor lusitanicus]|uniref:HCP-like protein n=2 Tax=Mucor circinelloides f. lusitanicus TaxID=29924 RepID=A0A8H4B6I0_MUCCL|nr:hypothetical protein FB192DRAFT_1405756 [Mucor lusitanicus]
MTIATLPEADFQHSQDAMATVDKSAFYTLDFEHLSIKETPDNTAQVNKSSPPKSMYTNSTIVQKPDEVGSSVASSNTQRESSDNSIPTIGTPTLVHDSPHQSPSLQHVRPPAPPPQQHSPSAQHVRPMSYSPQFQDTRLQHSPSMQPRPAYNNNNYNGNPVNRQPSTMYHPQQQQPSPPQAQFQYRQGAPLPPQSNMMSHQGMPPPSPHMSYNSNRPPPPPSHTYYQNYGPMRPMMQPPRPPQHPPHHYTAGPPSIAPTDNSYLADSSLSVANSAGKRPKKSQFPPATKENLEMFRNEARNGDPRATLDLAKFLLEAANQLCMDDQDPKRTKKARENMTMEAQKIVKKLATHSGMGKQGYPEAQFFLANCYGTGSMGLQTDPEKAFALYIQGSKQSHPGCTFRAAVCYEVGAGTKRDKNHAMQFYRKAANLGDNVAMYKLGMILLKGFLGQPKNPREGISWLKRASQEADEDHPHALHELGLAYEKEGIPSVIPDLNYARELFTQAAQYGYAPSQFKLGLAYENGFLNCPVDPRRSIAWYSKAAEQGDVEAEFALSGWYLTGAEGVLPQSDNEAYLWARKAADRGNAKAEYAVGYYTETGTGVRQNLDEAKRWYMRAAAQNYRRAMQRLTELKYGGARPQQRRQHTRDGKNTSSSNSKDSECTIM